MEIPVGENLERVEDQEDDKLDLAWYAEITRRVAEIRSGTARGRPVDEVLAE
jgi:hypothetical protein